jgi:hypothetical protein
LAVPGDTDLGPAKPADIADWRVPAVTAAPRLPVKNDEDRRHLVGGHVR